MCAQVVLAEDDPRQAEVVRRYLVADGHRAEVVHNDFWNAVAGPCGLPSWFGRDVDA